MTCIQLLLLHLHQFANPCILVPVKAFLPIGLDCGFMKPCRNCVQKSTIVTVVSWYANVLDGFSVYRLLCIYRHRNTPHDLAPAQFEDHRLSQYGQINSAIPLSTSRYQCIVKHQYTMITLSCKYCTNRQRKYITNTSAILCH